MLGEGGLGIPRVLGHTESRWSWDGPGTVACAQREPRGSGNRWCGGGVAWSPRHWAATLHPWHLGREKGPVQARLSASPFPPSRKMATNFLVHEKIWFDKFKYDDAERKFYEQMNGPVTGSSRQVRAVLGALGGSAPGAGGGVCGGSGCSWGAGSAPLSTRQHAPAVCRPLGAQRTQAWGPRPRQGSTSRILLPAELPSCTSLPRSPQEGHRVPIFFLEIIKIFNERKDWFFLHCLQENGASVILRDIARARENIQKSLAGVSTAAEHPGWRCRHPHATAHDFPQSRCGLCP